MDAKIRFGVDEFTNEGRIVMIDLGHFLLYNVYFPNSGAGERLDYKMRFYNWFYDKLMLKPKTQGRYALSLSSLFFSTTCQNTS